MKIKNIKILELNVQFFIYIDFHRKKLRKVFFAFVEPRNNNELNVKKLLRTKSLSIFSADRIKDLDPHLVQTESRIRIYN